MKLFCTEEYVKANLYTNTGVFDGVVDSVKLIKIKSGTRLAAHIIRINPSRSSNYKVIVAKNNSCKKELIVKTKFESSGYFFIPTILIDCYYTVFKLDAEIL